MKKTLTKRSSSVLQGDSLLITTSMSAKVVAAYQSVSYQAGVQATVPLNQKKKGFEEAWQICTEQINLQLEDAESHIEALLEVERSLADRD